MASCCFIEVKPVGHHGSNPGVESGESHLLPSALAWPGLSKQPICMRGGASPGYKVEFHVRQLLWRAWPLHSVSTMAVDNGNSAGLVEQGCC